jgi:hypothetical protein
MTPEERQLIAGLFDRMRSYSLPEKDREAEALINEGVRDLPDAPYMLVQSVLVQEHALQEADKRIKALEEHVRSLESGAPEHAPGSGSFLGGLFGAGRAVSEPTRGGSVPQVGARATPSVYDSRQPWTPPQGGTQQPPPTAQQAAPAGGGFLRTAMATAAGVAGGMLAASAIRDLLGGSSAQAADKPAGQAPDQPASAGETAGAEPARSDAQEQAPQQQDQTPQDVADEDSGWFSDDGGDWEI